MQQVAVTSHLYVATAYGDDATMLDEERVLPPQLIKASQLTGFNCFITAYDLQMFYGSVFLKYLEQLRN